MKISAFKFLQIKRSLELDDNELRPELIEGYISGLNIAASNFKIEGRTC